MLKEVVFLIEDQEKRNWKEILFSKEKENCLIVTDDPQLLKQLLAEKFYTIGLHRSENRDTYFEGAAYVIEDQDAIEWKSYEEIYCRLAGLPFQIFETERLLVRESTVEDVEDFYHIYQDPSITYYMEDLFEDPEQEREYMKDYIKKIYGFYGYGMWTVIQKKSGKIIGRAGLSVREGYELAELGFMIGKEYQRCGYAYEVCREILNYAKEELEFNEIQALVEPENIASKNLLKKLGFVYEKIVDVKGTDYEYMVCKN